jgi:Caspase domain
MKKARSYWMRHSILIIISFFATLPTLAQGNYAGKYTGTANWSVQNFELTIEIKQEGQSLTGIVFIENIKKTKSATYELKGAIMNGTAQLKGTKYIEKKGAWCLPGIALRFETGSTQKLAGKWKSNGGKSGCWVAGVGNINLTRVSAGNTIAVREPAVRSQVNIADDDRQGKALSAELQKRSYYALIIAVQDYKDQSIVDLDEPLADARALRNELIAEYTFKPENITFLQNPDRTTIIETFDELTTSVSSTDNLLVFYAGHGIWDEQIEQGYWLPSDAKKSSKAAWLSNGTIRDYIRAIDSKHTLLITDACFGGGILKTREAFTASKAMLEMYKLPSRKAMTSGALKTVPDKSVFIEYLIKALKANEQPLISADQLFTSFKYNVINNSPNGQVPQYGVISQADDEGGDFIFLKK